MNKHISTNIKDKIILITGGTGSFGNTVIAALLKYSPKRIIIFSRDEQKQFDMRNLYDSPKLKFVIGDVRDKESLERVMEGVDYVFHAAALKQVPSCEFFPLEAVKTNILGAHNAIEEAIKHKVKRLVILSTDKAVYPINTMGMTKALMEKVMMADARKIGEKEDNQTILCGVRYGNVMYSRGSVIPYFIGLIKQDKPLAVTNPDMTRFLLPLVESVDLVLYALTYGQNGHMYVRKSPACTLKTLAEALCQIFEYKVGYVEVGVRAGEKVHETLVSSEEMFRASDLGDYFDVPPESQDLDYNRYFLKGEKFAIERIKPFTSENTRRLGAEEMAKLLLTLPEIQEELKNFSKN